MQEELNFTKFKLQKRGTCPQDMACVQCTALDTCPTLDVSESQCVQCTDTLNTSLTLCFLQFKNRVVWLHISEKMAKQTFSPRILGLIDYNFQALKEKRCQAQVVIELSSLMWMARVYLSGIYRIDLDCISFGFFNVNQIEHTLCCILRP